MNDNNVFCEAGEVQVGDNVWEHQIVKTMDFVLDDDGNDFVVFNAGQVGAWKMPVKERVMVSNR